MDLKIKKISLEEIVARVYRANDAEISDILVSLINRYNHIHQDNEMIVISLPKNDPEERRRILAQTWKCLQRK